MLNHSEPQKHGWFQFRLRTLFIGIVILSALCAWMGYSLNWIRQRQAFKYPVGRSAFASGWTPEDSRAPLSLRLFGEDGVGIMWIPPDIDDGVADRAAILFPEATIVRGRFP